MNVQDHISPIEQHVIDFVRKLRMDKDLTQEDIASILEVSRSYIGDIESPKAKGKYNMSHVNTLADHFNISPRDFFPDKAFQTSSRLRRSEKVATTKSKSGKPGVKTKKAVVKKK